MSGLDEIDDKLLKLLQENARFSYSELAEQVGISRVAVKKRIQNMENRGVIRGYEVKIDTEQSKKAIEFVINISPRAEHYDYVVGILAKSDLIKRVQASTGDCKIFAYGVAESMDVMDAFYRKIRAIFSDVRYFSFDVIASTYKDVDGGITYESTREKCTEDAGRTDL